MKQLLILIIFLLGTILEVKAADSHKLSLINLSTYKTDYLFKEIPFGGISGLTYNEKAKELFGVSDDRVQRGVARFYKFNLVEKMIRGMRRFLISLKSKAYKAPTAQDKLILRPWPYYPTTIFFSPLKVIYQQIL